MCYTPCCRYRNEEKRELRRRRRDKQESYTTFSCVWLEQKAYLSRAQHKGITLECAEAIVKDKIKRSISMFAKLFRNLRFVGNKTGWHMRVEFKAFKAGRNSQELFEEIEKFANAENLVAGFVTKWICIASNGVNWGWSDNPKRSLSKSPNHPLFNY